MPALGAQFESSKYLDIPAVQTGLPPWPPAKSTIYGRTLFGLYPGPFLSIRGWALAYEIPIPRAVVWGIASRFFRGLVIPFKTQN